MTKDNKAHKFTELLSSEKKAKLKGLAHHLKPVVQVGNQGLSENVVKEIAQNLEVHELIKIQLPGNTDAQEKKASEENFKNHLPKHAHLIGRVGRCVIVYLEKEPQIAKIKLKSL